MKRTSTWFCVYPFVTIFKKRQKVYYLYHFGNSVSRKRNTGLEPVTPTWKDGMLPLHQFRKGWEISLPALPSHKRKYKTSLKSCQATDWIRTCDPTIILPNDSSRIRTYDRLLRRQLLYPTELLSQSDRFLSPPILNLSKGTAAEKRFVPLNVYSIEHYCGRVKPFC